MERPAPHAIKSPRRLLLVGPAASGKLAFLQALTGSLPPLAAGSSHAGLSHTLDIDTPYYTATLPIWVDEIPTASSATSPSTEDASKIDPHAEDASKTDPREPIDDAPADPAAWSAAFSAPSAAEVRNALGGFVLTFRKPTNAAAYDEIKTLLCEVGKVVKACGYNWDGVCLAVAMPQSSTPHHEVEEEEWEVVCREAGFEYVDSEVKGRNEYGEPAGMDRVKEALEANDWEGGMDLDDVGSFGSFEDEEEGDALKPVGDEMEREMFGLHTAIFGNEEGDEEDEEKDVEQLESAMQKLMMLKDMGNDMSKEERKRAVARMFPGLLSEAGKA